jgi:ELWxxDGT repeat protein
VTVIGSKAYFAAQNSANSNEPWVTDGTQPGTFMLADTDPKQSASPVWYQDFHGVTVFEVQDSNVGNQLFQTDGTTGGTKAIGPIGFAPVSVPPFRSRPHLVSGQNLFFSAVDPTAGAELSALPNDAPVAAADNATSENGAAVTITVLANDTDSDGSVDPSSIKITTNPAHGTVTVGSGGSILYTPSAGYTGQDVFAYTVTDNQGAVSAPAQVTVNVTPAVTVSGGSGSKGGGGGSIGYSDIAALLALIGLQMAWRARPYRQRTVGLLRQRMDSLLEA